MKSFTDQRQLTMRTPANPTSAPIINGLTPEMVTVTYVGVPLDATGETTTGYGTNLGTATVKIDGYTVRPPDSNNRQTA